MSRIIHALLIAFALTFAMPGLAADRYPDRPIRFVIPFPPGGGTDLLTRALQDKLESVLGVTVVIDNRGGGGGTIGCAIAAKAAPDGYTYLVTSASYTFAPSLYKKLPYDAIKDFKPVTNLANAPLILAVHPSMPVKSVQELLALARKHPGEIDYASAGVGSNIHLTTELFKYMAKVNLHQVPYKGGGPATVALISGEVQVVFTGVLSAIPFIKSRQMRPLAVTTKERSAVFPDLPTIDESGVPGYDKGGWTGLYAPSGVSDEMINQLYQSVAKVLRDPEIVKRLGKEGLVPVANPPTEFTKFVHAEIEEWAKLIKTMNLSL
jgi:tripartite-type tricarboxylate transporter receptor subunit TctC